MAPAGRPPLIVMGMHRSGTSVVTAGLPCVGVSLGARLSEPRGVEVTTPEKLVAPPLPPRSIPTLSTRGGPAPLYVVMDGSNSYDPDGGIARFVWHCGDGIVLEGVTAQHVYDPQVIPARYQVVLQVFDSDGLSHSSAVTVEVY